MTGYTLSPDFQTTSPAQPGRPSATAVEGFIFKLASSELTSTPLPKPAPSPCSSGGSSALGNLAIDSRSPASTVEATPARNSAASEIAAEAERRIVVRLHPGETLAPSTLSSMGLALADSIPQLNIQVLRLAAGQDREAVLAALRGDPRVIYAEPDALVQPAALRRIERLTLPDGADRQAGSAAVTPNDPCYPEQWALQKINAPEAWSFTTGSSDLLVAVIDTGFDLNHPDLAGRFHPDSDQTGDLIGHGTNVTGILAASGNNGIGVAGMAWGVQILAIKSSFTSLLGLNIMSAADHGAKVISMSVGCYPYSEPGSCGPEPPQYLVDAVRYARERDVLIVAAAGNEYGGAFFHPASIPGVMAVTATTPGDTLAEFSSTGENVSVSAPGWQILSTVPPSAPSAICRYCDPSGYLLYYGTSMAPPLVSGLAALIRSAHPELTADQVRAIIEQTAVDLGPAGWDPQFGYGRIDAAAALAASNEPPTAPLYIPLITR